MVATGALLYAIDHAQPGEGPIMTGPIGRRLRLEGDAAGSPSDRAGHSNSMIRPSSPSPVPSSDTLRPGSQSASRQNHTF